MATQQELQQIVRTLNGVKSAGQARAAIGAASVALHNAYPVAKKLPSDRERATSKELDLTRTELQAWYRAIEKMSGAASLERDWPKKRKLVEKAYVVIAGVEGEAHYTPQTSNLDILVASLKEAPAVFGKAVGAVAKEVGATAGSAVGGILGGLGVSGVVTIAVVLLVVLVVLKRGTLVGRLLG